MAEIDNNSNATQLLEAVNTAFGNTTVIQELLASDNAADLIDKLNHNFEVMGTGGGDAVFPDNTILPCAIGSFEQGEDIGGITLADFITYGINYNPVSAPRKLTFLHCSDTHANYGSQGTNTLTAMQAEMANDPSIAFAIDTGDIHASVDNAMSQKYIAINNDSDVGLGKMLVVPGNHDAYEGAGSGSSVALQAYIKSLMTYDTDKLSATFGSEENYGCYWYRDFPLGKGKLRVIGIDQYNFVSSGTAHKVYITQGQMDWFVDRLEELDGDDYLLLAQHTPPMPYTGDKSNVYNIMKYRRMNDFCSARLYTWGSLNNDTPADFIPSLIDAWQKQEPFNKTRSFANVDASVTEDFSQYTPATFIGWVCGHLHDDFYGPHPKYTNQLVMDIANAGGGTADYGSDIRTSDANGASKGVSTIYDRVTIDVLKKSVHIKRLEYKEGCACSHTVDPTTWEKSSYPETLDPHWDNPDYPNGWTYPKITRDEITFDLNAMK